MVVVGNSKAGILKECEATYQQIPLLAWARLELKKPETWGVATQAGGPHEAARATSPSPHTAFRCPGRSTLGQQAHNNLDHWAPSNA